MIDIDMKRCVSKPIVTDSITHNTLIMMVGLPRSGKSTVAKKLASDKNGKLIIPIVDTDCIRKSLGVFPFVSSCEDVVWLIAKNMVRSLFLAGHPDVILDATSLTSASREDWKSDLYNIVYVQVETDKETCIRRAVDTDQAYLVPVIEAMNAKAQWPNDYELRAFVNE